MISENIALLGQRMKDRVTGQAGVVTSICFDLYGCVQAILNPGLQPDGKLGETNWFDVKRLVADGDRVMDAPAFDVPAGSEAGGDHKPLVHAA
ncbi:MAG: hypothetical protein AB7O95_20925 [Geminicoccaceae bacterium]